MVLVQFAEQFKLLYCIFKAAVKLTQEQRTTDLEPLLNKGWSLVNGRDAIYKEFIFKDFNQVK